MIATNIQMHFLQKDLLKKLSLSKKLKFNQLLIKDLESVHMNYHLQKLKSYGLVKKEGEFYSLTNEGKDYINRMDDVVEDIERQPKTSILINGVRKNKSGKLEFLLTKRLKQPFFGIISPLTGKVRFGETFEEAASRELMEETGLKANFIKLEGIYHILRKTKSNEIIQDVIFYEFFAKNFEGDFTEKLPYQENFWITKEEFDEIDRSIVMQGLYLEERLEPMHIQVKEYFTSDEGY